MEIYINITYQDIFMEINQDYEKFYAEIVFTAGSLRITIPKNITDGAGYKAGDKLKVWIRKVEDADNIENDDTEK